MFLQLLDQMEEIEANPSSPYYLHPNENPSLMLTSSLLTENFYSWSRSMKMALISKNKLKFVDGSLSTQNSEDPIFPAWERCNIMVLSWLIKTLSPAIAQSIIWMDSATDLWKDLHDRFAQSDAIRISDLQEEISSLKQGNMSVIEYFIHLKILCDELNNLRPLPTCVCLPQCSCNVLDIIRNYVHQDHVIKFLKGLTGSFSTVKSQILLMDPIPSINRIYSLTLQHERQISSSNDGFFELVVLYARRGNPN